jgi:hypothetical protein
MIVYLLSTLAIAFAFLGMALGVIFGRRPLEGGCCGQRGSQILEINCKFCTFADQNVRQDQNSNAESFNK